MKLDYSALNFPATSADINAFSAYKKTHQQRGFELTISDRVLNIAIGVIVVCVAAIVAFTIAGDGDGIMTFIQTGIIAIVIVAYAAASKAKMQRQAKLYKFALANNAQYVLNVREPAYGGVIFDYGDYRNISDAIILSDGTEIGNYNYTTGSGKNRTEHNWGYARFKLSRSLPNMLLDAKSNNVFGRFTNLPERFVGNQKMSLEGDFDKYFTLYVPSNYQRDALYALTPDVMVALIDAGKSHDIEIVDDELFIYGPVVDFSTQSSMESILNIIEKIGTELRAQTDLYSDERIPSVAANIVAEPGRRLKKRSNIVQIIFSVIVAAVAIYIYASANAPLFNQ